MWSWIVIYESEGKRCVKNGGHYHMEMIARSMLNTFLLGLRDDQEVFESKVIHIPKEVNERTCL